MLFETDSLYVMPDKFPLTPGHVLAVSKEHLACYGAGSADVWRDLDQSAEKVIRFLAASYQMPIFVWENGVSGQSVFHAHLHFIPLPTDTIQLDFGDEPGARPITNWELVRDHFARHGSYRYLAFEEQRYLLPGQTPFLRQVHRLLATSTGLTYASGTWVKTTGPADVAEVHCRWNQWNALIK